MMSHPDREALAAAIDEVLLAVDDNAVAGKDSGGNVCLRGSFLTVIERLRALRNDLSRASGLDERQEAVIDWGRKAFGADHMADKIVRAARFFEEAAEMAQAVGLPKDYAQRAFDHVYSRPAGDPAQEAGGSMNTLMALCGAIGLSLDECQLAEIDRCLAKDPAHFAARNQVKLREVDAPSPREAGEIHCWCGLRKDCKDQCDRCNERGKFAETIQESDKS